MFYEFLHPPLTYEIMVSVGYTASPIAAWIGKSCQHFDRVAPVFFRAKIVRSGNVSFLCLRIASSVITVHVQSVSGCRTCSVGRVLLSSQGSHPASRSSSLVSLLRRSSAGVIWMWMASFGSSSLGCLAMSTTMVSSHLMVWWSFHACSAIADFSRVPFQQASRCSLSLVSSLLLVSPM